ncbi:MAG: acylphosphatase [Terrimicrobiaceae bacterium]
MKSVQVHYEGRVQGVGFRWTVKSLSREFDVAGTVQNLPDGRVEIVAQGDETDEFLDAIRRSVLAGHIENERLQPIPRVQGLRGFLIIP